MNSNLAADEIPGQILSPQRSLTSFGGRKGAAFVVQMEIA
jgi:hypothetical protein